MESKRTVVGRPPKLNPEQIAELQACNRSQSVADHQTDGRKIGSSQTHDCQIFDAWQF